MGLDGISISQLRNPLEQTQREYNSVVSSSSSSDSRAVGAMSNSGRIDPDKDKENDNFEFDFQEQEKKQEPDEETIKYDLSDSQKYFLNIDDENNIVIIDKKSGEIVQKISSDELSRYVSFLSNSNGSIVNRRF